VITNEVMHPITIKNAIIENTIFEFVWFSSVDNSPGMGVVGKLPLLNININVHIVINNMKIVNKI
jgi:hypothetical protein